VVYRLKRGAAVGASPDGEARQRLFRANVEAVRCPGEAACRGWIERREDHVAGGCSEDAVRLAPDSNLGAVWRKREPQEHAARGEDGLPRVACIVRDVQRADLRCEANVEGVRIGGVDRRQVGARLVARPWDRKDLPRGAAVDAPRDSTGVVAPAPHDEARQVDARGVRRRRIGRQSEEVAGQGRAGLCPSHPGVVRAPEPRVELVHAQPVGGDRNGPAWVQLRRGHVREEPRGERARDQLEVARVGGGHGEAVEHACDQCAPVEDGDRRIEDPAIRRRVLTDPMPAATGIDRLDETVGCLNHDMRGVAGVDDQLLRRRKPTVGVGGGRGHGEGQGGGPRDGPHGSLM